MLPSSSQGCVVVGLAQDDDGDLSVYICGDRKQALALNKDWLDSETLNSLLGDIMEAAPALHDEPRYLHPETYAFFPGEQHVPYLCSFLAALSVTITCLTFLSKKLSEHFRSMALVSFCLCGMAFVCWGCCMVGRQQVADEAGNTFESFARQWSSIYDMPLSVKHSGAAAYFELARPPDVASSEDESSSWWGGGGKDKVLPGRGANDQRLNRGEFDGF